MSSSSSKCRAPGPADEGVGGEALPAQSLREWLKSGIQAAERQHGQGPYLPLPTRDAHDTDLETEVVEIADETEETEDPIAECQASLRLMFDDPSSSQAAAALQWGTFLVIMIAVACAVCETVPEWQHQQIFLVLEPLFTALFTLELSARWWVSDTTWHFFCNTFNLIDILSTIPGYVDLMMPLLSHASTPGSKDQENKRIDSMHSLRALRLAELMRIVRLLRVLRVAKTLRQSEMIVVVLKSIYGSLQGIWVLLAFSLVGTILSSTMVYCLEMDQDSGFDSIPVSMWWGASTITAVGYGDLLPKTVAGRLIAVATMFLGTIIMAVCIAVITNSFTIQYQREFYLHRMRRLKREAEESGVSPASPLLSKNNWLTSRRGTPAGNSSRPLSIQKEQSTVSTTEGERSADTPGEFGGAGMDADYDWSAAAAAEDMAMYLNQLEEMTEEMLLSFEAVLESQEQQRHRQANRDSPQRRRKKTRGASHIALDMLRKSSTLWFEQARCFSEELSAGSLQDATELGSKSPNASRKSSKW
eukprot:TRINITY_DN41360_c0_g1_i1.p1 TRINITY_DN41360_c0_g1~~TRINITY_DN41360_c0_g1_i1.p1  ORF type:complete len:605 (+),score=131.00 TRINITY_DN41360_c0_g1_i1:223-1815(+)